MASLAMGGQSKGSETTFLVMTGQTGILGLAFLAKTGQEQSSETTFLVITGQTEGSGSATLAGKGQTVQEWPRVNSEVVSATVTGRAEST